MSTDFPEWNDLPITLDRADDIITGDVAFRAALNTGVRKAAAIVPVTRELLEDSIAIQSYVFEQLDRHMRPWLYFWRAPFPRITLFPRLERWFPKWFR